MTPKEQYEARKAERKKRQQSGTDIQFETTLDIMERIATVFERIADAMEYKAPADEDRPN